MHYRDPSFTNLQAVAAMCEGGMVADVIAAVASIDPVMGVSTDECGFDAGPAARQPGLRSQGRRRIRPRSPNAWPPTPPPSSPATRTPARRCCRCCTWCSHGTAYLTAAGIAFCADQLGLTAAEVTAVATFYSMYRRTPPATTSSGVHHTLCAIMGGDAILDTLENELGVHAGQTTDDGLITLGAHRGATPPATMPRRHGELGVLRQPNPSSASELVAALRSGQTVTPTRGAALCRFRETARTLAGLGSPLRTPRCPASPHWQASARRVPRLAGKYSDGLRNGALDEGGTS